MSHGDRKVAYVISLIYRTCAFNSPVRDHHVLVYKTRSQAREGRPTDRNAIERTPIVMELEKGDRSRNE